MKTQDLLAYFLLALGSALLVCASFLFGLFSGPESALEDLLFTRKPVDSELVILSIDDESLERIGPWPWPREVLARVLTAIERQKPRVVGVDVLFAGPSRFGEADDAVLEKALAVVSYPVVLAAAAEAVEITESYPIAAGEVVLPEKRFSRSSTVSFGHTNIMLERDGVVRRVPLSLSPDTTGEDTISVLSFAYEIVLKSGRPIPYEKTLKSVERIAYAGAPGSVRDIPLWRALEEEDDAPSLRESLVFIGVTSSALHDEQQTPVSGGTNMSGVEIQAHIANMLLQGYRLTPLSSFVMIAWISILAALVALAFFFFPRSIKPLLVCAAIGAVQVAVVVTLFERGVVADVIHLNGAWLVPTGAFFTYRYLTGERERRHMRNVFSRYVAGDVLEEILSDPAKIALGGEERKVTLLFSDIRGFTTMSEKTTPQELVRILNVYFTAMTGEVLRTGGVVDKYIGDAVMAFWGAPIADSKQAEHAFDAARGMLRKLTEVNAELSAQGAPAINIGIGIYTGPAVVGNIGSLQRFDYTAMGDTVNVASRLEGLTKEHHTRLIIGESTKQELTEEVPFIPIGSVRVKGRNEPVTIYTIPEAQYENIA